MIGPICTKNCIRRDIIDKNSESLRLIQFLRNEAHRFGIEFHRLKRSNALIDSQLFKIPGVGQQTVSKLFTHFKSIEKIKNASEEELVTLLDRGKAKKIIEFYRMTKKK